MSEDRPQYRISADRRSASRRVRYVERSRPDDGQCTICKLDELADLEAMRAEAQEPDRRVTEGQTHRDKDDAPT